MIKQLNLNEQIVFDDCSPTRTRKIEDVSDKMSFEDGTIIESVFKDLDKRLIELIREFKDGVIIGCVAWLTHNRILTELSKCRNVQILVQKEDFLRPDINYNNRRIYHKDLRALYDSLECNLPRFHFGGVMSELSVQGGWDNIESVRCVGNYNEDKLVAFPRSHHKFLVFCDLNKDTYYDKYGIRSRKSYEELHSTAENNFHLNYFIPKAVWTGSFNLTKNATMSLENAIIIRNDLGNNPIVDSYFNNYREVFTLSEPLNWEHEWCEPEYRIGT